MIEYGRVSIPRFMAALAEAQASGRVTKLIGGRVKPKGHRYVLFQTQGTDCITCGAVGAYFALESHTADIQPHFNLYAINSEGKSVLMTKDHVKPRAKGGPNAQENYQPMCVDCNGKKSDKY